MMREKTRQNFLRSPLKQAMETCWLIMSSVRGRLYAGDIEVGAVCALYSLRVAIYTVSVSNDGFAPLLFLERLHFDD